MNPPFDPYKPPDRYKLPLKAMSWIYSLGLYLNSTFSQKNYRCKVPVICVGNLTVGGTGKTPICILLAKHLEDQGYRVGILSRGYGSTKKTKPLVFTAGDNPDPADCGDEPRMMAEELTKTKFYIFPDREVSARLAEKECDILLMDDGAQRSSPIKDITILCFDGSRGWGNGKLIPAGPMRVHLSKAKEAEAVLFTKSKGEFKERFKKLFPNTPCFEALTSRARIVKHSVEKNTATEDLSDKRVLLVSGIANPDSFKQLALSLGVKICGELIFSDHEKYDAKSLVEIERAVVENKAECILVSYKDAVKLPLNNNTFILLMDLTPESDFYLWLDEKINKI